MNTKFIEASNQKQNWGKFCVGQFTEVEWRRRSALPDNEHDFSLLATRGWTVGHYLVLDMETGEGALFFPFGAASPDLNGRHNIWVCPLFEPFLNWLYGHFQCGGTFDSLPDYVDLPDAPFEMYGYRRRGDTTDERPDS